MCIARKVDEQDPHSAPKAEDGTVHEAFIRYLELLYSPEEAEVVQHLNLPDAFLSSQEVADACGKDLDHVQKVLADVQARSGVIGIGNMFCLPLIPMLLNAHNFYPEVKPGDIEAARLYKEYFIASGFYRKYETVRQGTPVGRVIPIDRTIEANQKVLAAEEAHDYILNHAGEELALVPCPCRTRTEKLGIRECRERFPIGACIFLGAPALIFESTGLGKRVTKQQAIDYLDEMVEIGLVSHTLNTRVGDRVICLCCGCCCSQLRGRTLWNNPDAMAPSNFAPKAGEDCVGCQTCADQCLLGALALDEETGRIEVDLDKCIGCGVCTLACPQETLKLHRVERSSIAFETSQELDEAMRRENRKG